MNHISRSSDYNGGFAIIKDKVGCFQGEKLSGFWVSVLRHNDIVCSGSAIEP